MPPEPEDNDPSTKEEGYDRLFKALQTETSTFGKICAVLAWRVRVPRSFVISFRISYGLLAVALLIQGIWKELLIGAGIGGVVGAPILIFIDKKTDKSLPIIGGEPVSRREHTTCTIAEVAFMGFTILTSVLGMLIALLS